MTLWLANKNSGANGYFGKLNPRVYYSFGNVLLRTLHTFSCSWPTANNGSQVGCVGRLQCKNVPGGVLTKYILTRSEFWDLSEPTRPSRTWLLAGIRGNFLLFAVFEVRWPRPNIELGWPAPCRLGGGHFADLPFHRGELRSRRTENPDSALRQNPPTLQFSHYNFLLVARIRVLNIVSGRGFKFTIDHVF